MTQSPGLSCAVADTSEKKSGLWIGHLARILVARKLRSCSEFHLFLFLNQSTAAAPNWYAAIATTGSFNAIFFSHFASGNSLHDPLNASQAKYSPYRALRWRWWLIGVLVRMAARGAYRTVHIAKTSQVGIFGPRLSFPICQARQKAAF